MKRRMLTWWSGLVLAALVCNPIHVEAKTTKADGIEASSPTTKEKQDAASKELEVKRVYGNNRYQNAVAMSQEGWQEAGTVYISNDQKAADALTGSALAGLTDSPILFSQADQLPKPTRQELDRLQAKEVVILGGEASVSREVEEAIKDTGRSVRRIAGKNRYQQAVLVADQVGADQGKDRLDAFLVNGESFSDALSIAPVAARRQMPIYLTQANRLNAHVKSALPKLNSLTIIGGYKSVSKQVEDELKQSGLPVRRLSGANRYAVNRQVIQNYTPNRSHQLVVSGEHVTDALPASVLAARLDAGLLFVKNNQLTNLKAQVQFAKDQDVRRLTLIGGTSTLSKQSQAMLQRPNETLASQSIQKKKRWNRPARLSGQAGSLYSKPKGVFASVKVADLVPGQKDVVDILEEVILSNGSKHYRIKTPAGKTAWLEEAGLTFSYVINTPFYHQKKLGFPMGCEAASLLIALQAKGYAKNHDLSSFIKTMPYAKNGNPNDGFSGRTHGRLGEYNSIYPKALAKWGRRFGQVEDISGRSLDSLLKEVLADHPVVVYVTMRFEKPRWRTYSFGPAIRNAHVMVLDGYDAKSDRVHVTDPNDKKMWVDRSVFEASYNARQFAVMVK